MSRAVLKTNEQLEILNFKCIGNSSLSIYAIRQIKSCMYDICVIGSGIVGKYIAHHIANPNKLWISGHNAVYQSKSEYKLEQYLGVTDTWQEKATGLFSFPQTADKEIFPFPWSAYQEYEKSLKEELQIKSLSILTKQEKYANFVHTLESIFPNESIKYFSSAHSTIMGPSFSDRSNYDAFWLEKRPHWSFCSDQPTFAQADYFEVENGEAKRLICRDSSGKSYALEAKRFIVACHTPGSITLFARTFAHNQLQGNKFLGRYFSDHAQTSLGILLPNMLIPRTTLASFCYQDREFEDIKYRLEFHIAPPRTELVKRTRMRLPHFSEIDFEQGFVRVVVVYQSPKLVSSRLLFQGKDTNKVDLNASFLVALRKMRKKLLPHLLGKFFSDQRVVLLNQHYPFFFAGHLAGGLCFPEMVDANLALHAIHNVQIAGLATLRSTGLFNPSFAALISAKHILKTL